MKDALDDVEDVDLDILKRGSGSKRGRKRSSGKKEEEKPKKPKNPIEI